MSEQLTDPYAELKAARAAGKTIQLQRLLTGEWVDEDRTAPWAFTNPPEFYRIKPEVLRGNKATASVAAHWYLSGPMSGLPELNFPAFHNAAAKLRSLGMKIVNPAEHQTLPDGSSWADYMRQDIRLLMDCQGIVMLSGWEQSKGALLEYQIAQALGLPVLVIDFIGGN